MQPSSPSRAYYDDFSTRYEDPRAGGYHALIDELEVSVVAPFVTALPGTRVLEVGCGTGLILDRLRGLGANAVGVDLSAGMASRARARTLRVALATATDLPFADASFDVVCSFKVLAHVPEIGRALAEIARVTRPGGTMVLDFYNAWSVRRVVKKIAGPQSISADRDESDVFTRWDSPLTIPKLLPPSVDLCDYRGVRVFTPAAALLRFPVLGSALSTLERWSVRSPVRYFAGFLVAVLRKHERGARATHR